VLFFQQPNGKFIRSVQPALDKDSTYEEVDAAFADVNNDRFPDLLVASGGNEFYGNSEFMNSRVYLNDGKGNFTRKENAIDRSIQLNASCIKPGDVNGDGFTDLFIGGRSVPWAYGQIPRSYLLLNDGTGKFKDVTGNYNSALPKIGIVTNAAWCDLDKDGLKDLVISLEWGGIVAFKNNRTGFEKKMITDKLGWWNNVFPVDIDGDGDPDLLAGNLGENNRLKASRENPVKLYFNDFDDNGKKEQLLTYFLAGKEITFANKDELTKQLPYLKKKFLYAGDFAKASLEDIFGKKKLDESEKSVANYFSNAILVNNGNWNFTVKALPWQAQLSSYRDVAVVNANNDALPDLLLAGNFYPNNIQMGMYDADYGTLLVNEGKGNFRCANINGPVIKGEVRHILPVTIKGSSTLLLVKNNDSARVIKFR